MVGFAVREFVTTWVFLCIKKVKNIFYLFDAGKPVRVLSQQVLIWEIQPVQLEDSPMWRNILILVFGVASLFLLATLGEGDGKKVAEAQTTVVENQEVGVPPSMPLLEAEEPSDPIPTSLVDPTDPPSDVPADPDCVDSSPELCWQNCGDGLDPCPEGEICHKFEGGSLAYCVPGDQSKGTALGCLQGHCGPCRDMNQDGRCDVPEVCDSIDNDGNGQVDEGCPLRECDDDSECKAPSTCHAGRCLAPCTEESCPTGQFCSWIGVCTTQCEGDLHCGEDAPPSTGGEEMMNILQKIEDGEYDDPVPEINQ